MTDTGDREQHGGLVLLFESTHAALSGEETILAGGFWCDVVPRPPGTSDDLCGLAVEVDPADQADVAAALHDAGISFNVYRRDVRNGT